MRDWVDSEVRAICGYVSPDNSSFRTVASFMRKGRPYKQLRDKLRALGTYTLVCLLLAFSPLLLLFACEQANFDVDGQALGLLLFASIPGGFFLWIASLLFLLLSGNQRRPPPNTRGEQD